MFVKRKQERIEHVWMKAFLWALYLPEYPSLSVEIGIGDKYKPDVVAMDRRRGRPRFWGEAGHVDPEKMEALLTRYPDTHFAIAKWAQPIDPVHQHVEAVAKTVNRTAPVDLLVFSDDSAEQFLHDGHVDVSFDDVQWTRIGATTTDS